MSDVAPLCHQPPRRIFQHSAVSSLQDAPTAFSEPAPTLTAARTQERFSSQASSWWPQMAHGAPRPSDPLPARKPEHCANAANSWIPADGRSRTRTWDLFPIRTTVCPLQSPQLANNPCRTVERRLRKTTGDDWGGRPGGPTAAVRGHGVVWPGSGHHADDTVKPDAPEARRTVPSRWCAPAASFGAPSGPSARGDSPARGERLGATFSPALAMPPRRHRLPFAPGGDGAVEKPVPPRMISRQASY